MAEEQACWNAQVYVRSEFWLLNPPCPHSPLEGRDFAVVQPGLPTSTAEQVASLMKLLELNGPRGPTPLAERLRELRRRLQREVPHGQRIMLSIVTDGVPTSSQGECTRKQQRELIEELRHFTSCFNAFVVIRLATADEHVAMFYRSLDEEVELPLDILSDLKGEADEVHGTGNGWLTYSPLVQRIREGGTTIKLFDLLDERALRPLEIATFLQFLFQERNDPPFPRTPAELYEHTSKVLANAALVFDGRTSRMLPPVDLRLLRRALQISRSSLICTAM